MDTSVEDVAFTRWTVTGLGQMSLDMHRGAGDLLGSDFNPDGTLSVVWTRNTLPTRAEPVTARDIYYARSR